jgi:hypothetical protein
MNVSCDKLYGMQKLHFFLSYILYDSLWVPQENPIDIYM